MKISEGTYARVKSDQELLLAVAYFISKGFEFEDDEIYLGENWEVYNTTGLDICVVVCEYNKVRWDYVESVKEDFENPVQISIPSAAVIDRYVYAVD